MYTWTFQRVPHGSLRVSIYHPLGFNWHPLEGAGIHMQWIYKDVTLLFYCRGVSLLVPPFLVNKAKKKIEFG